MILTVKPRPGSAPRADPAALRYAGAARLCRIRRRTEPEPVGHVRPAATFRRSQYRSVPGAPQRPGFERLRPGHQPHAPLSRPGRASAVARLPGEQDAADPGANPGRVGVVEAVLPSTRPADILGAHWIMVYLLRRPDWRGRGCWSTSARTTARSSSPSPSAWNVDRPVRRPAAGQRADAQFALVDLPASMPASGSELSC